MKNIIIMMFLFLAVQSCDTEDVLPGVTVELESETISEDNGSVIVTATSNGSVPEDITIYTSNIVKKVLLKNKINNPIKILDEKGVVINSITVRSLPTSYPYYRSTFSILFEDQHHNTIFHEGHRVNFRYLVKNNIKADVAILAADETKLFGFIQLGMNYKNTLKAAKLLESKELFITGNNPEMTKGFIKNFLLTKTFNIKEMLKTINVSGNEGDSYTFK